MKKHITILLFYAALSCPLTASLSFATVDNTTISGAIQYEIGQGWLSSYFDASEAERWFTFKEESGHSYCVEVAQGSLSPTNLPAQIDIYSDEGGSTLLTSYNRTLSESNPDGAPARICYISPASEGETTRAVEISATTVFSSAASGYLKMRILDTTFFAPSFSIILYKRHGVDRISSSVSDGISLNNYSKDQARFMCTPVFTVLPAALAPINPSPYITNGTMLAKKSGPCGKFIDYSTYLSFLPVSGDLQYSVSGYIHIAHEAPPGQIQGFFRRHTTNETVPLLTIY